MKRILIVASIVLAFAITAGAQDVATGITTCGIKAGLNLAKHTGSDTDDNHSGLTSFAVGGFVTYVLMAHIALQPELFYTVKGWKWDDGFWSETGKFTYLEIPVLVKYMVPMEGNVRPNLYAGPSAAFLLSAKVDWETELDSGSNDVKDDSKSTEFNLVVGGGVDVPIGNKTATFDIRYTMGMSKIDGADDPANVKNAVISILAGFGF
ncbi:MAG: PorT family protein [candidate division Zixibacteria bacterium]|nr:PorT family protein [candidate division Zixibacteria bacterium]